MGVETQAVGRFFREGETVTSLSEAIYSREPEIVGVVKTITDGRVEDKIAVRAPTGQSDTLILCWLFGNKVKPSPMPISGTQSAVPPFLKLVLHLALYLCPVRYR
jgi:hypothetical protein